MPQYRLSPPVHKSNWRNIWEGIKDAWRAAGLFGKLTFVFRLVWSLLVLGFLRKMITVILVALGVAAVAVIVAGLVIWGMLEGGYKFFLHPVTMFLAIPWMVVGFSYLYLSKKYPGKYARVSGYTTEARYVRVIPIIGGVVASAIFVMYQLMKPFLWWILVGAAAIVGMVVIYYVVRSLTSGSSDETTKKAKEALVWALCLVVGLAVIHWLIWTLDEEFWGSIWATKSRFWAINLGIILAILFLLIKGADGKTHWVAAGMSKVIGGLVAMILIVCLWDFMTEGKGWSLWAGKLGDMVSRTQSRVDNKSHSAPMEVALAIIADCESGGGVPGAATHFEKDGKTPLKNKEGSTAIGKYQILASAHEKRAKEMGFDITTEADNEAYARVLYQESGTRHWEADARSKACWEPKLRAYTWGSEEVSLVVVAPLDRESGVIPTPQKNGGGKFDLSGGGKKYQVRWNVGMPSETVETLPRAKDAPRLQPDVVYNLALKSAEKEPVSVIVKFY